MTDETALPPSTPADILARRLHAAGVRHAFGMPGGEVLSFVAALERAGIEFVLVKHENSGGFMAEAVHHRTGAPALLVATLGPGALNAINVVENARQDRVPMIVVTGAVDADEAQSYTHQVLDQQAVFRTVTKGSFSMTAGAADVTAAKALALALAPRQGPVHVDLPIRVADMAADPAPWPAPPAPLPAAPAPSPGLDTARAWLADAERPLAIAGLDVLAEPGAAEAVARFCTAHGVPLVTSYKAKGVLPEDHPLSLGGAGLSPLADRTLLPLVAAADLVLCLGYDPIEMRTGWRNPWDPAEKRVIEIAHVRNDHGMHAAGIEIVAGVAPSLAALSRDVTPRRTWPAGEPAAARAALARAFPRDALWGPEAVIATCREILPGDTLATADSGAHRILLSQMWACSEPKGLTQSTGFCTMGCALPLAIGAKLAEPGRVVAGFMGDAGFLMVAGELATAAERGLAPIFVVFADAELALIELKQRQRQLPRAGVSFGRHDFAAIARAFGGEGHTVTNRLELAEALRAALASECFTVISAVIPGGSYDGRI
ncbi:thiamine pyrophosphate-binding protein [Poseidonocella sp. HB161398]|uniref:thiamine pyrophosphate-binding protein n=1 Tax=Poseidonocella sp. HB161398 TaxID=2320855 RepID=UPI001109A76A|nr:thiamine pyrophosphate-binding protein [Poseidonocella sp. HB161398]